MKAIIIILLFYLFDCTDPLDYTKALVVEDMHHKLTSGEGKESCLYKIAVLDSAAIPSVKRDRYYYDCTTQVGDTVMVRVDLLN